MYSQKTLHLRKSVIIFDEIQLQPLARQAIKYLVEDGRYDYIETGSL
jgi:predicted AAA+ superfamily ATPase